MLNTLPTFGPKIPKEKSVPNKVKIKTIENPKNTPERIALPRLSLPRIKNDTVIGIIGKTQGVNMAANPANAEIKIKSHKVCPLPSFSTIAVFLATSTLLITGESAP